jgi:hypothetical protein
VHLDLTTTVREFGTGFRADKGLLRPQLGAVLRAAGGARQVLYRSALFAYKIDRLSVMFFGYGDDRTLDDKRRLQSDR